MENFKSDEMCLKRQHLKKKNKGKRELCFDIPLLSKQGDTLPLNELHFPCGLTYLCMPKLLCRPGSFSF